MKNVMATEDYKSDLDRETIEAAGMAVICALVKMVARSQRGSAGSDETEARYNVDPEKAKAKFTGIVRDLVAGHSCEDLNPDEIDTLRQMDRRRGTADRLPSDVADALKLDRKSTYGEAIQLAERDPH